MSNTTTTVAVTILEQLGGRKMIAMTGASNFIARHDGLAFKLPGRKINKVCIHYDRETDLYNVAFFFMRFGRNFTIKTVAQSAGLDVEQMRAEFEHVTGLRLSL